MVGTTRAVSSSGVRSEIEQRIALKNLWCRSGDVGNVSSASNRRRAARIRPCLPWIRK